MKKYLLLFSLIIALLFTGCISNSKDIKSIKDVDIKINKLDILTYEYSFTQNNEILLSITNNSKGLIDYLNVDIAFFDSNNNLIKVEKEYIHNFVAGAINIVKSSVVDDENKLASKVEVVLNPTIYEEKYEKTYTEQVIGTITPLKEGQLNLNITNNSGLTLDEVAATVIFYKEGKMIDISKTTLSNVEATTSQTIYIPVVENKEKFDYITYDDVKVVIDNASIAI